MTSSTCGMTLRWLVPLLVFASLFGGCFEKKCGPRQKLKDGYCECVTGTKLDDKFDCVKIVVAPVVDAGMTEDTDGMTEMPSDGCDKTTGLGCVCMGDSDCAGKAADYCIIPNPEDPSGTRACLYQGCDKPGKECPTGLQCCAFPFAPAKTVCLPKVVDNMDYKCPF